jgi:hypothetical protein
MIENIEVVILTRWRNEWKGKEFTYLLNCYYYYYFFATILL